MRPAVRRASALLVAALLGLAACSDGDADGEEPDDQSLAAETDLNVATAGFDLHVGEDRRLLAGVTTQEAALVAFGEVDLALGPVDDPSEEVAVTQETRASFLPVPGDEPEGDGSEPTVLVDQGGAGVYEAFVDLDQPGTWAMRITAELADGTTRRGTTYFEVTEEPQVPAVGEEAPRSRNLTVDDIDGEDVRAVMVDSRAQDPGDEVPDPSLHDSTIAESLEEGRPVVALFSTPVYCRSRFCGPITETVAELAEEYDDRADFVHVEVWRDFEDQELNDAAGEWIQTPQGGSEPWTFLVDEQGTVAARWDNVLDAEALRAELERLPAMTHTESDES